MTRSSRPLFHAAALLALLLLAFALRVYALDAQSLWYDEAVTAQVAQQGLGELAQWTADDIQPPLYYAVVAGWTRLMGSSEWALRFPSVACGLLMVALAYALGKRLFGQPAAWLALLLAGIHPLWVYYSQEARMYTLLTALSMLAGYALLRVVVTVQKAGTARQRLVWWSVIAVASIGLLYTHYFAAFLLLAFGLFFVLAIAIGSARVETDRGSSRRRLLVEGALVALIVAVAYLPWLPNALHRFNVDASYWQGTLKLDEAIRHIAISFTTGETVLEQQAIPLAWGMAVLASICWLALVWTAVGRRQTVDGRRWSADGGRRSTVGGQWSAVLFVTFYLFIPVIAILFLSYRTPKFNPRYLMLASPALVLVLAGGLALPFAGRTAPGSRRAARAARLAATLALLAVVGVFLFADRNWFTDPAFTKDDWRGAVAYVRAQLAPDEGVVLVSGHALPAWRYYAPDIEPVRLPELEILDVNAVLNLDNAATALDSELAGKQGAWLVQWQNGVVDPTGVTAYLLESAGTRQPADASFWGLGSPQHYRWPADASFQALVERPFDAAQREQELRVNFGNQVELVGYAQPSCDRAACPVYLFWRSRAPLQADYKLTAALVGRTAGEAWNEPTDRRLAGYDYPTFRWPQGTLVLGKLPLDASLGTPPGEYRLRMSVYDAATGQALDVLDSAGAPQGQWAWLDPVSVDRVVVEGPGQPPAAEGETRVAPSILLQDLQVNTDKVEPGESLLVDAWWLLEQPQTTDYALGTAWLDASGTATAGIVCQPIPFSAWPAGAPVRTQLMVTAPAQLAPGPWRIRFGLLERGCEDQAESLGATMEVVMEVLPSTRLFEPPAPVKRPVGTALGNAVEVVGISGGDQPEHPALAWPGATTSVTVTWKALQPMDRSYTGFVHLLNTAGTVVAQDDHVPRQGQYPTTRWLPGEVVEDRYDLRLPDKLPPGEYWLEIGLYNADQPGLPRLKAPDGRDSLLVGSLLVTP